MEEVGLEGSESCDSIRLEIILLVTQVINCYDYSTVVLYTLYI